MARTYAPIAPGQGSDPAQLNALYQDVSIISQQVFNVREVTFGAVGDGSTDDSTAIQAALTAGAGGTVLLPKPPSYYRITASLMVASGTTILLDPGVIIEQVTKYTPVFDCNQVNDITIQGNGALLRYTGSRAYTGGSTFRGGDVYTYGAGVYAAGDRIIVRNLRITGFTSGVYCSGWDGAAQTANIHNHNIVENIVVGTVDFGVLFTGQSDLTLRGIRGQTVLAATSPNPSHLLYGSNLARNRQVVVSDCEAADCLDSFAFQIKGVDGGTVKNLTARNCAGLLSEGGGSGSFNTDLVFSNISGRDLLSSAGSGAVFMQGSSLRVRIDGVNIHQATSDRALRIDGTDCAVSNVTIRARHDVQADTHDVTMQGTRNTLDGISILNIQDDGSDYATAWRGISVSTSTDCIIRPLTLRNVRIGIEVAAAATNPTLDLSGTKFTLAATSGLQRIFNSSTTLRVITGDHRVSADNGNAAKTLTFLVDETTQRWNTALTTDRAVTLSTTGATQGARFRIVREAGATGAFNLNIGSGPLKSLTAASQWADFEYDSTAWRLVASGTL